MKKFVCLLSAALSTVLLCFSPVSHSEIIGQLPHPIANNAVASVKTEKGWQLLSFNGLSTGKDWQAVSNTVQQYSLTTNQARVLKNVPFDNGRLASIAVTVANQVYLFGGYTVAQNHEEKSMPDVYRFDPKTGQFDHFSDMPIPVDDTVALVYQDRYIYLVSGWHDIGNIADVQVLDTHTKRWFFATPFPGKTVFGHAAGIVDNKMVVVDGVKVAAIKNGRRQYKMAAQSLLGTINPDNLTEITWQTLPAHPGKAKYRMAATGVTADKLIVFAAGSDNPYNFNGIGYNKVPSKPSNAVFAYNLKTQSWQTLPPLGVASMDHRALLPAGDTLYIVGGMLKDQRVTSQIQSYTLP